MTRPASEFPSPQTGLDPQIVPEELLLRQALEQDAVLPGQATPAIDAAITTCDQLIRTYQTWDEPGIERDYEAIQRGSDAVIKFYDVHVSEDRKEQDRQAAGWGWDPAHLAASALKDLLVSKRVSRQIP